MAVQTLIVACVHQAETEFGKKVLEKYNELYSRSSNVLLLPTPRNQESNAMNKDQERHAYASLLQYIETHKPELIIDIHHGWGGTEEFPYSIHLMHDPHDFRNDHERDMFQELARKQGVVTVANWPRPSLFENDARFMWCGTETMLTTTSDESNAKNMSGQAWYDVMTSGIQQNECYRKAIEHTAKIVRFLHTDLYERFYYLMPSSNK